MVFGWGKKKLEENEINVIPKEKHILLSDVSDILEEISSVRTKTIMVEVKTFRNKIGIHKKFLKCPQNIFLILKRTKITACWATGDNKIRQTHPNIQDR